MSRVHKTNFPASWDEIDDEYEMQDTYALTQMNSLEGKNFNSNCPVTTKIGGVLYNPLSLNKVDLL